MIFLCAHTQEGEGLVEWLACLFEAKTYSPGEDTYASWTHKPVEDTCTLGEDMCAR